MSIVRTESRCRIGITWYSTEREADKAAHELMSKGDAQAILDANIGIAQCGRAPQHDKPDEYAVITP